jgi:hypothetical protein
MVKGTLFLDCFLAEIGMTNLADDPDWGCEKEWVTANGRIDILLQSKGNHLIIAIENKIRASDEPTQLCRYRDWLDAPYRRQSFPVRRLLYLTLKGEASKYVSPRDVDYQCISYREHVLSCLQKALQRKIEPVQVQKSVEQYMNALKLLVKGTLTEDPLDKAIIELSMQPKHRSAALALARCAPTIEHRLLRLFWADGKRLLRQKLDKTGYSYWMLKEPDADHTFYLNLLPHRANDRPRVTVSFYQYRSEKLFRLELCVQLAG